MQLFMLAGIAVVGFALGAAAVWLALRSRGSAAAEPAVPAGAIPLTASADEVAGALGTLVGARTGLRLLAIYAGREHAGALDAKWRAADPGPERLPLHAPETLLLQVAQPQLVDPEELGRGLRPGLPPAAPEVEASQLEAERAAEAKRAAEEFHENPFELDDGALTEAAAPAAALPGEPVAAPPAVDEATLAARVVAAPWRGPFGWRGILVAEPSPDRDWDLAWLERAAPEIGERVGVHCEAADRLRAESRRDERPGPESTPTVFVAGPAPEPERAGAAGLRRAEARLADALLTPRREQDLVRATVGLLAEGLAPDRCYALEAEGLHVRPVEYERRSEAAASAVGLDFGSGFLQEARTHTGATIKAITLDAGQAAEWVPEAARARLGPVSRMMLPVLEKGRIVVVFVAEWIDLAKRWDEADVAFGERVAARAAAARERILQFEAIAEQAAHARASQEQVEAALEQLQALLAALPEALVALDADGRITFANRAAARLFGRREFELMGRWVGEVAADLDVDAATLERVMAAAEVEHFPAALTGAGGTVDVTVIPGVGANVGDRVLTLAERGTATEAPAPDGVPGQAGAIVREIAEPLSRLLGSLELVAGGSYGELTPVQEDVIGSARRVGADLRAKIDRLLRHE
jgi:PAS domain S-box-containing protein